MLATPQNKQVLILFQKGILINLIIKDILYFMTAIISTTEKNFRGTVCKLKKTRLKYKKIFYLDAEHHNRYLEKNQK
jgi:type IV secretory pathway VirB3-like protein